MPYYCTVPRCTSMAGKAKNVSFHQFPRDEELAKLWNNILKRGKPYTKYSKVCSLHFRPEDYTITSVGKNKGQWRTLRKDAIPSQNLPSEGPPTPQRRSPGAWVPSGVPVVDPQVQHQMAQAIYLQTMLAMQVTGNGTLPMQNFDPPPFGSSGNANAIIQSEIEKLLLKNNISIEKTSDEESNQNPFSKELKNQEHETTKSSFKCDICTKCFKDPDVLVLHKRTHSKQANETEIKRDEEDTDEREDGERVEKENFNANRYSSQETLRANPILANLLKTGVQNRIPEANNSFDVTKMFSLESQIMAALTANMESYLRNLPSLIPNESTDNDNSNDSNASDENDDDDDSNNVQDSDLVTNIENLDDKEYSTNLSASRFNENDDIDANEKINNHLESPDDNKDDWNEENYENNFTKSNNFYNTTETNFFMKKNNCDDNINSEIDLNRQSSKEYCLKNDNNFEETYKQFLNCDSVVKHEETDDILPSFEENHSNSSLNINLNFQPNDTNNKKLICKTAIDETFENYDKNDFSCKNSEIT